MMAGYHGRYGVLHLPSGSLSSRPLAPLEARSLLGGVGLAALWLLRHAPIGVDPLGPDNPLIFTSAPLVDTGVTTTSRAAVAARSPQTGLIGESLISSHFAIALRRTGWDGLVITGRCPELSLLVLDEDRAEIRAVPGLAGLTTSETERAVEDLLGPGYRAAVIGPAGEHRVRYSTICHNGRHAGRTGMGAVMGSKRLKAIAVRGNLRPAVHDEAGLRRAADGLRERSLGAATEKYRLLGTAGNMLTFDRLGVLPAHNFRASTFSGAAQLTGEQLAERPRERSGCAACTIGCDYRYPTQGGSARAEYETLFALGPLLGLENADAVLAAARLCDELGLDTLSAGGTLAWAVETAERGLFSSADLDSADLDALRAGDGAALLRLLPEIACRATPLGDLLADGSREAARRTGGGSEYWAMHVKGLELPGYDPRAVKTLALGLAVGSRGACHNRSSAYDVDFAGGRDRLRDDLPRGADAAAAEDRAAVLDALGLCKFLRRCFDDFYAESAELLNLVTGWDVTAAEIQAAGSRIVNLKRQYNEREGATRADDTLPPRILQEPIADGPARGVTLTQAELDRLLDDYYQARGWTR
jgi:aldehyde:ferredoxin oxidoreductase